MKALVKAKAERGIWMQDIDKPEVGHNDVLIKMLSVGVCGSDIHYYVSGKIGSQVVRYPFTVTLSLEATR